MRINPLADECKAQLHSIFTGKEAKMLDLTTLFVKIDDFCQIFQLSYLKHLRDNHLMQRNHHDQLSMSEIMTLIVLFHASNFRSFKYFYYHAQTHHSRKCE